MLCGPGSQDCIIEEVDSSFKLSFISYLAISVFLSLELIAQLLEPVIQRT